MILEALWTVVVLVDLALTLVLWNKWQHEKSKREIAECDARFWNRNAGEWREFAAERMTPEERELHETLRELGGLDSRPNPGYLAMYGAFAKRWKGRAP